MLPKGYTPGTPDNDMKQPKDKINQMTQTARITTPNIESWHVTKQDTGSYTKKATLKIRKLLCSLISVSEQRKLQKHL